MYVCSKILIHTYVCTYVGPTPNNSERTEKNTQQLLPEFRSEWLNAITTSCIEPSNREHTRHA